MIEADPEPEAIEHAVQVHQRQPEHVAYAALEQLAGNYVARLPVAVLERVQARRVS
jgi:hypothetical protein